MSKGRPKQKGHKDFATVSMESQGEPSARLVRDAVNLKDQQIALIRRENQKLMGKLHQHVIYF